MRGGTRRSPQNTLTYNTGSPRERRLPVARVDAEPRRRDARPGRGAAARAPPSSRSAPRAEVRTAAPLPREAACVAALAGGAPAHARWATRMRGARGEQGAAQTRLHLHQLGRRRAASRCETRHRPGSGRARRPAHWASRAAEAALFRKVEHVQRRGEARASSSRPPARRPPQCATLRCCRHASAPCARPSGASPRRCGARGRRGPPSVRRARPRTTSGRAHILRRRGCVSPRGASGGRAGRRGVRQFARRAAERAGARRRRRGKATRTGELVRTHRLSPNRPHNNICLPTPTQRPLTRCDRVGSPYSRTDDRLRSLKYLTVAVPAARSPARRSTKARCTRSIRGCSGTPKRIRVNRVVRGTGVAHPSFRLDSLLQGETLDVVLIER